MEVGFERDCEKAEGGHLEGLAMSRGCLAVFPCLTQVGPH